MAEDSRFSHIAKDPKFRRVPKTQIKTQIDKRFQSMFNNRTFQTKNSTDKRGRPLKHSSKDDLKRYYHLTTSDEESSEKEDLSDHSNEISEPEESSETKSSLDSDAEDLEGKYGKSPKEEHDVVELEDANDGDKGLSASIKKKLKNIKIDYARGESKLFSDSSSDDEESDDDVSDSEAVDHKWGELDADAERTEEITNRLAVCNMNWDRIKAVDLMVLFNSFLPPGGVIQSVAIYPSEFGKERMKEEDLKGPTELFLNSIKNNDEENNSDDNAEETEEGSKYSMEIFRQYQLNRLKYYYAVVTCDTPSTGDKIYTECDGIEYESSGTKVDLRFIPNDMTFDDSERKDMCEKLPEVSKYKPKFFTTTALQQRKVDLTWDENNPERLELLDKINSEKFDEMNEEELKNIIAYSSESDTDGEIKINKYKELLNNIEKKEKLDKKKAEEWKKMWSEGDVNDLQEDDAEEGEMTHNSNSSDNEDADIEKYKSSLKTMKEKDSTKDNDDLEMEMTWDTNLEEKTEAIVKKKIADNEDKTPFQKYLDKKKKKRKEKRKKKKEQTHDSDSEVEDIEDIPSDVDMNDPYFAEEFKNSSEFEKKKKGKKKHSKSNNMEEENKELELLLMTEGDSKTHFNIKKIQKQESNANRKKKLKTKKQKKNDVETNDDFQIDVTDSRFSALFSSYDYNIDQSDPHFTKTKTMETLIAETLKRSNENRNNNEVVNKKPKLANSKNRSVEMSMLVKSVKRKANNFSKQ